MNLREAAKNKFEGCERDELVVYCGVLGVEVKDGHTATFLRKKLTETLGEYQELNISEETGSPEVPVKELKHMNIGDLNLSSTGRWQGRRRRVTLHRAAAYDSAYPLFLAWENLHVYFPYGTTASLPWPIWKILESTSGAKKLVRRRQTDTDGRVTYREEWVPEQPYMFTDHGDDEATIGLPGSVVESVRMMYHASNGFKSYNERQLKELCRRLRIRTNRDWTREQLIMAIEGTLSIPIDMGDGLPDMTTAGAAASG